MMRTVINNVYKGRKVCEIAQAGLSGKEDVIMLFRELINSFPADMWKEVGENEDIDYIRYFESETDRIAKGDERKKFSKEELQEQETYEKYCLESNKDEIQTLFEKFSKVDY